MKRSDITDTEVCRACRDARAGLEAQSGHGNAPAILMERTGAPYKVAWRAIERAEDRGLLECGTSLRWAWLTPKGERLLSEEVDA